MTLGVSLFLSLFNNLAIFILLVAVYGYVYSKLEDWSLLSRQAVFGLLFGLFAISCMYAKIPVAEGVIVDQRNTIIALSGGKSLTGFLRPLPRQTTAVPPIPESTSGLVWGSHW